MPAIPLIAKECEKKAINPMDDTGYKTVLDQYNSVSKLREKFESNPFYLLADTLGFPIVKSVLPDVQRLAKRWIKEA